MALRGLWQLSKSVEIDAKVVVVNTSGGARQGQYTAYIEVQDPADGSVLASTNVIAPYVEGVPGDRLCYWTLQFENPKLVADQPDIADPPNELIKKLQERQAKLDADARLMSAREAVRVAEAEQAAADATQPKPQP